MNRLASINADLAPLLPPLLAPLGLWLAGIDAEVLRSASFLGVAGAWLALVAAAPFWRQRIRRVSGGRQPGLGVALWLFAGLSAMLLVYKMVWGLEHAGGLLAERGDVLSRGFQFLAFYAGAVFVSLRPARGDGRAEGVEPAP